MKIKNKLSEIQIFNFIRLVPSMLREYIKFSKGNARSANSKNREKELTNILMLSHSLEKGFTLPHLKKSFGKEKALNLIGLIEAFINKYGFQDSLIAPLSILKEYVLYHKNNLVENEALKKIERQVKETIKSSGIKDEVFTCGGTYDKTKGEMLGIAKGDFKTLAEGRFSIRNFDSSPVDLQSIYSALEIASKAPSACNRQSYRVHIFEGENKNQILNLQGGNRGFTESIDKAILITADLNRYYSLENHLGYVDGSLFAMSLIYALTYQGIGSIPLTLGIKPKILKEMRKNFNIPEHEIPVVLIGIGNYAEKFKVAQSHRNPVTSFTTFHT